MQDIKTKNDVRNFFSRDPNTGEYTFMMGFSSHISESAWILLDDEEAKALLIRIVKELWVELTEKLERIEERIK